MKGVMNPADQLPIIYRVKVVLLVTGAYCKALRNARKTIQVGAKSEILAAKCLGENFLSEIKVRPVRHSWLLLIGQSCLVVYVIHTNSIIRIPTKNGLKKRQKGVNQLESIRKM